MGSQAFSRRRFLLQSVTGPGWAWLATHLPEILRAQEHARHAAAARPPTRFEFFTPAQAAEVEAMAGQIIPTDEAPGAREAGVVYFIDRALATFDQDKRGLYLRGLEELQGRCSETIAAGKLFSELDSAQQIDVLKSIEKTDFFSTVRVHTIIGFLASEEYGGNKDQAGWKLIGFEDEHSFDPPFGFYDRPENKGG